MEFDTGPFMTGGAIICAIAAVANAFKYKKRGNSAFILSIAFLVLGGTMLLDKFQAPMAAIYAGIAVLLALLILDFIVRSDQNANKDPHR